MTPSKAIAILRHKLLDEGGRARIPKLKGGSFTAQLVEGGISVDNLRTQAFLPWEVFEEAVRLMSKMGGRAERGNAMNFRLGEAGLPLDSVEGHIAHVVYNKKIRCFGVSAHHADRLPTHLGWYL